MQLTDLVAQYRQGDRAAYDQLFSLVYDELHRLASAHFRSERKDHTLQPTALIHEVYLRMARGSAQPASDRQHFVAIAARVMRQILVDHARAHATEKRTAEPVMPFRDSSGGEGEVEYLLALNFALERLQEADERKARVVELYYFGGLTVEEIAETMESSVATVGRDLRFGRAWLRREMKP